VDLLPSAEQLELVGLASEFFAEQLPISKIRERRGEPAAITRKTWAAAAELGLFGLSLPEDAGGLGLGLDDEALLFREIGRALAPGPFIATVLGARLAARSGNAELARSIAGGEAMVALAQRRGGDPVSGGPPESGPESRQLTGQFDLFDVPEADYVLFTDPAGAGLAPASALADVKPVDSIDPGTRLASAAADGAPLLAWLPAAAEPLRLRGLVLASSSLTGIARAVTDLSVEYAKNRVQFGRPIGVNQAIKHACVDMAIAAEAALEQTLFGAISLGSGRPDAEFQVFAASVVAGRAAIDNSAASIQVHGGMGYTDEHDAHLYLKRAHVLSRFFGTSRGSLASLLAADPAQ
jgi:alkylation response protein AidB-like acyl-CoA dehydrogenase